MADHTVTILVSGVQYRTWLRTSYVGSSIASNGDDSAIEQIELGLDQEDALTDFLEESTREVLKLFESRQGDVNGVPFEYNSANAIYRFNEATPVLSQAASLKSSLDEDVKNAIYTYTTFLWFKFKQNDNQAKYMADRYEKISKNINHILYKLHD